MWILCIIRISFSFIHINRNITELVMTDRSCNSSSRHRRPLPHSSWRTVRHLPRRLQSVTHLPVVDMTRADTPTTMTSSRRLSPASPSLVTFLGSSRWRSTDSSISSRPPPGHHSPPTKSLRFKRPPQSLSTRPTRRGTHQSSTRAGTISLGWTQGVAPTFLSTNMSIRRWRKRPMSIASG